MWPFLMVGIKFARYTQNNKTHIGGINPARFPNDHLDPEARIFGLFQVPRPWRDTFYDGDPAVE